MTPHRALAQPKPTFSRSLHLFRSSQLVQGPSEAGDACAVLVGADRDGHSPGAGDRTGLEVNLQAVFGVAALGCCGRGAAASRVDAVVGEELLELASAVSAVTVHCWPSRILLDAGLNTVPAGGDLVQQVGDEGVNRTVHPA